MASERDLYLFTICALDHVFATVHLIQQQ